MAQKGAFFRTSSVSSGGALWINFSYLIVLGVPAQNATLFSTFSMFVPSLSWQNDAFYIQMAQKVAFPYPSSSSSPITLRQKKVVVI